MFEDTVENAFESAAFENITKSLSRNVVDNATYCSQLADNLFSLEQDTRLC